MSATLYPSFVRHAVPVETVLVGGGDRRVSYELRAERCADGSINTTNHGYSIDVLVEPRAGHRSLSTASARVAAAAAEPRAHLCLPSDEGIRACDGVEYV